MLCKKKILSAIFLFSLLVCFCLKEDCTTESRELNNSTDVRFDWEEFNPDSGILKLIILDGETGTILYRLRIDLGTDLIIGKNYKVDVLLEKYSEGVLSGWSSSTKTVLPEKVFKGSERD